MMVERSSKTSSFRPTKAVIMHSALLVVSFLSFTTASPKGVDGSGSWSPSPSWSAERLFEFDPKRLLAGSTTNGTLSNYVSGWLFPESLRRDMEVFERTCNCDSSKIDPVGKRLEVINATVRLNHKGTGHENLKTSPVALRVGRLSVRWNSYLRPRLEVEMEDVDILVEFVNLVLTKTNWNDLAEAGFPPTMYLMSETETKTNNKSDPATLKKSNSKTTLSDRASFVRIGSLDLSGSVVLRIRSRPLDEPLCPDWTFDLSSLDDLTRRIRERAKNDKDGDDDAMTTVEVYETISEYVWDVVRQRVGSAALKLAKRSLDKEIKRTSGSLNEKESCVVVENVKEAGRAMWESVVAYTEKAARKLVDDRINVMSTTLEESGGPLSKWGVSVRPDRVMDFARDVVNWSTKLDEVLVDAESPKPQHNGDFSDHSLSNVNEDEGMQSSPQAPDLEKIWHVIRNDAWPRVLDMFEPNVIGKDTKS